LTVELERFRDRVEDTQSLSLFDPFPPPCLVKKKLGQRQSRLIADARHFGEHTVIVFLAIMIRGSRAYEDEFNRAPQAYWEQYFRDLVSPEELTRYIQERTATAPPPAKPNPGEIEYAFLYGAFTHHEDSAAEDMVCESREWVDQVTQDRIAKQLALFCKPCLEALSLPSGLHFVEVPGKPHWGVWAMRSPGRLLLMTTSTESTADSARELAHELAKKLEGKDATAIIRASRRAYPALVLADDDLWIDLEKDPIANMALSPEESEVLESARRSEHPFPLFINGRAGSGKSTILQYLFADLLFFYLSRAEARDMAPPIYLTANGDLLRVARSLVERLLKSEATFAPQTAIAFAEDNKDVLDEAFREFQPHLLSLVPADERLKRFNRAARVDYTRFRRMWLERFGKDKPALRDFGPDLSWHVIRSYIKGMSSETYLEPEDYAQLPENQITVTHEAFKLVHDRVWLGWYQHLLQSNGLWDDQDLTRFVLDEDLARPLAPAIVCDEAQDFTRLELELLLRLNLFSDRNLSPRDIRRVPFAFAGDQFQTLNPTGFRWDAIKASFVEKFVFELSPASRSGRVDLNYRELKFNYRSTHKIVRFGNHVQAMRAALFDLPDVRPQTAWAVGQSSFSVVWFRADDAEFWKKFRANPNLIVLVPCNEGEEAWYVRRDPYLRDHVRFEDDIPLNVLSVTRAKGCEYPAVIAYGFGDATDVDIVSELVTGRTEATSDADKALPLQYFVNRVYVAVSRPKTRLIIVDTEEGLARVWKCAQEQAAEGLMLSRIKGGQEMWADAIEGMTMGDAEDVTLERAGDPLENAKAFEAEGLARHDAFLLRQAAQAYRSGDDPAKARECLARAYEAEGAFLEAGEAFFDAGFAVPHGVRCLWRAGRKGWGKLCERFKQHPQIQQELEYQWARLITSRADASQVAELLGRFAQHLSIHEFAERCVTELVWRDGIEAAFRPLLELVSSQTVPEELWGQLVASLDRIRAYGVAVPAAASAHVYFFARRYREAIELWDKSGEPKTKDYDRARASVEPYPGRIAALANLGLLAEVVAAFDAAPEVGLTGEQAAVVVEALIGAGREDDALRIAWRFAVGRPLLPLALRALQEGRIDVAQKSLHMVMTLLVRQEQWDFVIKFATAQEIAAGPEWVRPEIKEWVRSRADELQVALVRALARSDGFSSPSNTRQRQLAGFVRRYLSQPAGGWKGKVTLAEAGAAVERGGRFSEAIAFYETALGQSLSKEEKLFARQRRLVALKRHLDHELKRGQTGKTKELERELKQSLATMRAKTVDEFGAYPRLPQVEGPSLTSGAVPDDAGAGVRDATPHGEAAIAGDGLVGDPVSIVVGPFKLDHSPRHQRCNITNTETMGTAFVKTRDRVCGGETEFVQIGDSKWECDAWGVAVRFSESPNGEPGLTHELEIEFAGLGVRVCLRSTDQA
jgi:hypothetical protein